MNSVSGQIPVSRPAGDLRSVLQMGKDRRRKARRHSEVDQQMTDLRRIIVSLSDLWRFVSSLSATRALE